MRIYCNECGSKATITKTVRHSINAIDIYLTCANCSHRFIWIAGFKHSTSETRKEKKQIIKFLINSIPDDEKIKLIKEIETENELNEKKIR